MPEQNLEEPSCRYQRNGASLCFINNHMRLGNIFLFFPLNVSFLHSKFMIQYTNKSP